MEKYKLTEETIEVNGRFLHRIEALINFCNVKAGDKGGWVEKVENLSQEDTAWVYDNAKVFSDAKVFDNAIIYENAKVFGDAQVYGDAEVYGNAIVYGKAQVFGEANVYGNAVVYGNAKVFGEADVCGDAEVHGDAEIKDLKDYIVFKNWWSSGRYFTWTRSNNMWRVGCFYGTGKEIVEKAYRDSEESGREYERVVRYVESILQEDK